MSATRIPWVTAWADATGAKAEGVNPFLGCKPKSRGCRNCWAAQVAMRVCGPGQLYEDLVIDGKWTGGLRVRPDRLSAMLRWKRRRVAFIGSMSDIARPAVTDEDLDALFAAMLLAPEHTYLLLTKWPERLAAYLTAPGWLERVSARAAVVATETRRSFDPTPDALRKARANIWVGATVEDQAAANERRRPMEQLAGTGWQTWVSSEPRLGPIDWKGWEFLQWLVTGGESATNASPMEERWALSDRRWCEINAVRLYFKQWGGRPADKGGCLLEGMEVKQLPVAA